MQSPDIIVFDGKVDYPEDARSLWRGKTKLVFLDFLPSYPSPLDLNIVPNAHYNPQGGTPFVLYGLEYTIIGSHALARSPGLPRTEQIVITTGGSDPTGVMLHLLKVLAPCQQYAFTFLLGKAFKFRSVIESMRKSLPAHFTLAEYNIDTIRDSRATIATFGVTIYELLYLNVPCLLTAHSRENHEASLVLSSRIAGLPYLGFWSDLTTESVAACIADFLPRAPRPPSSFAAIGHGHRKVAKAIIHFTCSQ
jgi:spore coat polysaccharide biosynthesis predicted glycosyltransferase SpsG